MVWYSHLLKNFPQFVVIHTVKDFGVVEAEVDVFWNFLAFLMIQRMLVIWSLSPLPSGACLGAIWIQAHETNKGSVFVGFGFHFS